MAITKAKRSVHPAQLLTKRKHRRTARPKPYRRLIPFPQANGKVIETVEFSTCSDYHNISINFRDKTCLNFSIETGFSLQTDYSDWKTGNQRILRIWPPLRNKA